MMSKPAVSWVLVSTLCLTALSCGGKKASEADLQICEQAAKRYVRCTEEILGKEAADMVRAKKGGVEACARDSRTVAFYRDKCLPTPDCNAFMDCVMDLATQEP